MPYIAEDVRVALDPFIDSLAAMVRREAEAFGYDGAYAGLLNYCVTRLAANVTPARRYWALQLTKGTLDGCADEFKRRIIDPYEDEQIETNGDVYEYGRQVVGH